MSGVKGISEDEAARLTASRPYSSLQDLWQRVRPALPTVQRLIRMGALDPLCGTLTRRDLLLQTTELHRHRRGRRAGEGQLPIGCPTFAGFATGQDPAVRP